MTPNPQAPTQDPLYASKMSRADKKKLADAKSVRGLDDEIALLRLKLNKLVDDDPDNIPLIFKGADLIVRAVGAKARVAKDSPDDAADGIATLIKDVALELGMNVIHENCECGPECHSRT